ncbi:unnamed protein product [Microthlaspi erraticum]|uniref:Reverse transcriptase Ty1/copia-type domain-containing protein n=1 Tax=Microthlaspi erraticum TaxID=1685480 RepID=A0A6D2HJM3_9BRAS|nr:unnamed protein product [Microthlaspi erraticum]
MEAGQKLSKSLDEKDIDATCYMKNVGCFRYLLHTSLDLAYSICVLSRYMQSPKEAHGVAMKQCLKYLRGTTSFALSFERSPTRVPRLVGYSHSSHSVDPDNGKRTMGHVFYFGGSPISWCSQKQETVAHLSCEAEFMAGTEAARQAIWLQDLVREVVGSPCEKNTIRIDNQSAIALTKNPVFHGRSKHIHTRSKGALWSKTEDLDFKPVQCTASTLGGAKKIYSMDFIKTSSLRALSELTFQRNWIGIIWMSRKGVMIKIAKTGPDGSIENRPTVRNGRPRNIIRGRPTSALIRPAEHGRATYRPGKHRPAVGQTNHGRSRARPYRANREACLAAVRHNSCTAADRTVRPGRPSHVRPNPSTNIIRPPTRRTNTKTLGHDRPTVPIATTTR